MSLSEFADLYSYLEANQHEDGTIVKLCGRIESVRDYGKKLKFMDLRQNENRLQIKLKSDCYEGDGEGGASEDAFREDIDFVRRGDVVGVEGHPLRTASGIYIIREFPIGGKKVRESINMT